MRRSELGVVRDRNVVVRMTAREEELLDERRGSLTRSAYLRMLLQEDVAAHQAAEGFARERTQVMAEAGPEPVPAQPPVRLPTNPPPDPGLAPVSRETEPVRHWHKFEKRGIVAYVKGSPVYEWECGGCGERKTR